VAPGEKLGTASTFGIGGLAGLITVWVQKDMTDRNRIWGGGAQMVWLYRVWIGG
jgi:hypothetical protein